MRLFVGHLTNRTISDRESGSQGDGSLMSGYPLTTSGPNHNLSSPYGTLSLNTIRHDWIGREIDL